MSAHRWTWLAGITAALVLAAAWGASAKTQKPLDWVALNPAFAGATRPDGLPDLS